MLAEAKANKEAGLLKIYESISLPTPCKNFRPKKGGKSAGTTELPSDEYAVSIVPTGRSACS